MITEINISEQDLHEFLSEKGMDEEEISKEFLHDTNLRKRHRTHLTAWNCPFFVEVRDYYIKKYHYQNSTP